jgi:stage II sporulation protein AA (anti-sigma F factor antagonist)
MKLSVHSENGDVLRLRLEGRVSQRDIAPNEEPLSDMFGESVYGQRLALDMSNVVSLDSSGVNWLLVCQKRVRQAGGQLVLHSLSPIARNVIKVLNLQTVFRLADDEEGAVQLLAGEA